MYYSFLFLNNRAHTIKQREGKKKKSAATKAAAAAKKKENRKQVRASKRKVSKQSMQAHAETLYLVRLFSFARRNRNSNCIQMGFILKYCKFRGKQKPFEQDKIAVYAIVGSQRESID